MCSFYALTRIFGNPSRKVSWWEVKTSPEAWLFVCCLAEGSVGLPSTAGFLWEDNTPPEPTVTAQPGRQTTATLWIFQIVLSGRNGDPCAWISHPLSWFSWRSFCAKRLRLLQVRHFMILIRSMGDLHISMNYVFVVIYFLCLTSASLCLIGLTVCVMNTRIIHYRTVAHLTCVFRFSSKNVVNNTPQLWAPRYPDM